MGYEALKQKNPQRRLNAYGGIRAARPLARTPAASPFHVGLAFVPRP